MTRRRRALPIILLLALDSRVSAQHPTGGSKPLVYNDTTDSTPAVDRMVKTAMADKFRFIDTTQKGGFAPAGVKGIERPWGDPRSRDSDSPAKVIYAFVVTPDGRVIEPRIISTTDTRLSEYVLGQFIYRRFFPARFQGDPVYGLKSGTYTLGREVGRGDGSFKQNGLGIVGYRDR